MLHFDIEDVCSQEQLHYVSLSRHRLVRKRTVCRLDVLPVGSFIHVRARSHCLHERYVRRPLHRPRWFMAVMLSKRYVVRAADLTVKQRHAARLWCATERLPARITAHVVDADQTLRAHQAR